MVRKALKLKKLDTPSNSRVAETLRELPRPKLSRPFGHRAQKQGKSRLAARLEQLLGLSQKERKDAGMRLARAALSTLNLLIGSEQITISKKQAKRSCERSTSSLSSATTAWMLTTFLSFLRSASPEAMITQVAFRQPKRGRHGERVDLHPLAGAKAGFDGDKQTVIYSNAEFYRRDGVTRLYK